MAGTYDVTVTQGAQSDTLAGAFEYVAWSPALITTRFWASADHTDQFADRSGNGNPLTARNGQTLPSIAPAALNGLDVWSFNGSNQLMGSDCGITLHDLHVFIVFNEGTASQQRSSFTDDRLYISKGTTTFGATGVTADDPDWTASDWGVSESIGIGSDKEVVTNASVSNTGSDSFVKDHPVFFLGGGENHLTQTQLVDIAEAVIIDPATSAADIEKLQGYLHHKWGLEDKLPAAHPYKSSPP